MIIVEISEEEAMRMKAALLDEDGGEALQLVKALVKRMEEKKNAGMKSHLDG